MITGLTAFYIAGGTLRQDASSYVERRADRDLYEGLLRGEYCYVLHARQMGKSSLMVHTTVRLCREGVAVVNLDLTRLGQNLTVEQWYDGLLGHLGQQLDLEDEIEEYWLKHERVSPLQRWLGALREVVLARCPARIVLFLDEIDAVRSLPFSTDEFFAAIRECYNRRTQDPEFQRLTFCLLGVATPSDLIEDTRTTPFNIGKRIELTDFTPAEATPLAQGLGRDELTSTALLQRVLYWTGGQPYLTQRLCQTVAEELGVTGATEVDRVCEALFLSHRARERDDNLLFVRDRLLKSEADVGSLLSLYGRVRSQRQKVSDDETNPLVSLLRLSGIVRERSGFLQVRNRIYARVFDGGWIESNLPDAEVRRLRAEAREEARKRRLAEAQRRLAEERELTARRYLYVANMNVAQQAIEAGNFARAVQLLEEQIPAPGQEELRGFEWYYLWRRARSDELHTLRAVGPVAFSPDGRTLASGGAGGTVRLWDAASRQEIAALQGESSFWCMTFSSDGQMLAGGSADGSIKVWDVSTRRERAAFRAHPGPVSSLAFRPGNEILASCSEGDDTVRWWENATGQEVATLRGGVQFESIAFAPDGSILAGAGGTSAAGMVQLWDADRRRKLRILQGDQGSFHTVAFSPDSGTLAAGGWSGTITLWDIATGQEIGALRGHGSRVVAVAFFPDGGRLISASYDGTIRLWHVAERREIATLHGHAGRVLSLALSPDGRSLASAGIDRTVKLWDPAVKPEEEILQGHRSSVTALAFSPDGRSLVSGSGDQTIRIWNVAEKREVACLPDENGQIVISPDGRFLATASGWAHVVKLWDLAERRELAILQRVTQGYSRWARALSFSWDGRLLAAARPDDTVRLWEVETQREVATLRAGFGAILALAFSPRGRVLAVGSDGGTIRLWDAGSRREVALLQGLQPEIFSIVFSPNGRTLASAGSDGTIRLWDVETRSEQAVLMAHSDGVSALAFTPDGKTLISQGGRDQSEVQLWNVVTRREAATLRGHTTRVIAVAVSPDGRIVASGSADGMVRLWRAASLAETDR